MGKEGKVIGDEFSTPSDVDPNVDSKPQDGRLRPVAAWLVPGYGLLAVVVVALIQLFFSLEKGGYFISQWYWGASAVAVALIVGALIPGYLWNSSLGYKQWAVVGTLCALIVVVTLSISWSISPVLSVHEASRTAMYVGVFVLLLPAAARWGWLIVDATIVGSLLPPAVYAVWQKIYPTLANYTGPGTLETDARVSSTVGYYNSLGMMCAMGALLVIARVGSFRSLYSIPLRALYSGTGVVFLVALYFSFSRGALLALAAGAVVLLVLAKYRFEVLGNLAATALPALWVISQAGELPGIVTRPVSLEIIRSDGLALVDPLLKGILFALVAQVLFSLLVRAVEGFVPENVRRGMRIVGATLAVVLVAGGLFLGWTEFQQLGGVEEVRTRVAATYAESEQVGGEEDAASQDATERYTLLSGGNRIALWKVAWENWREHPLTGTGGDTFQTVYREDPPQNSGAVLHPHSMWMSLLSDTGIFAFVAFVAFCIGSLALACYNAFSKVRSRGSRALIAGSTAAATAYLVSSSIDWNWYIPASTVPFFALAAVAVGMTRRRRQGPSTGP